MKPPHAPASSWCFGLLLGVGLGTVVLGLGGRLAMRVISLATDQPESFSWGGTLTVVLSGTLTGAGGGVLFVLAQRLLPRQPWARRLLFWGVCVLITLRGLRGTLDLLTGALFLLLVLVYGVGVEIVSGRAGAAGKNASPTGGCFCGWRKAPAPAGR